MAIKNPISPNCAFVYFIFSIVAACFCVVIGGIEWAGYSKINGGKEYTREEMKGFAKRLWYSAALYGGCFVLCFTRWIYHYCTVGRHNPRARPAQL